MVVKHSRVRESPESDPQGCRERGEKAKNRFLHSEIPSWSNLQAPEIWVKSCIFPRRGHGNDGILLTRFGVGERGWDTSFHITWC